MRRRYTPEEIKFVKKNIRGRTYVETLKLFNKRFDLRISLKQLQTMACKHGFHNGLGVLNGYPPPCKGKKYRARPGRGNFRPVGSERVDLGYIVVKVSSKKYAGNKNWQRKHVAIYEAAHGKIPKGHVVIFADGNNRNFDLGNLLLVSRAELVVMNNLDLITDNKDLTAIGKTIADVKLAVGKRKRKKKGAKKCKTKNPALR
jgi:hypothetical protein